MGQSPQDKPMGSHIQTGERPVTTKQLREYHKPPEGAKAVRFQITQGQMNLILMAVDHGYRMCERGHNLQAALASVFDLYEVSTTETG